jgi:hypothetical protein
MTLSQKMQDLEMHVLETEIAKIKARPGNPLAEPMLAALARIVDHANILEAYVTPNPVSEARKWDGQRGWTLVVFREKPITETQTEIADLVFDAQGEGVRLQIDLLSWSENAIELGEAMAIGIQVWPADPEKLFRRSA